MLLRHSPPGWRSCSWGGGAFWERPGNAGRVEESAAEDTDVAHLRPHSDPYKHTRTCSF